MSFLSRRSAVLSLGITVAAYVSGVVLAGLLAAYATHAVGAALLDRLASAPAQPKSQPAAEPTVQQAAMVPLKDRWAGEAPRPLRLAAGPDFGSSSRNSSRWPRSEERRPWGSDDDDDDDDRPASGGTFRTVCVRLCDGYYFPVSFAVTRERLGRDSQVCESRCGAQGRLFVHRNPGGAVEDLEDLNGRPYRQLRTAYLYRSEYVPSCTCRPHPWEAASQDQHRAYALAQAARNGSADALKELRALQVKVRQAAGAPAANTDPAAPVRRAGELAGRDGESVMRLGGSENPNARPNPAPERTSPGPRSVPDWIKRAFGSGSGG